MGTLRGMKGNRSRGLKRALFMALAVAVSSLLAMVLWNWLMPTLFGLPAIGFWQALGLLVLSRILFGRSWGPGGMYWRRRMKDRMKRHERDEQGQSK